MSTEHEHRAQRNTAAIATAQFPASCAAVPATAGTGSSSGSDSGARDQCLHRWLLRLLGRFPGEHRHLDNRVCRSRGLRRHIGRRVAVRAVGGTAAFEWVYG